MKTYIVCYDIPDDTRRNKVATLLEGYGERRQYSVFECHLKDSQFAKLWEKLATLIDESQDSILCYPLSQQAKKRVRSLGIASPFLEDPDYYLA
jgi:CRISPR-associated protein Cas2